MANKLALVVDDSRVARLTLNKILLGHGFSVIEHDSAEAALQWLNTQSEQPDVVFMDLMMPGMDGITATQTIRHNPAWQNIPVVVCTGNDNELDKSKAIESGAIAVLAKPPAVDAVNLIVSQLPTKTVASPIAEPTDIKATATAIDEMALLRKLQQQLVVHLLPKLRAELSEQLTSHIHQTLDQQNRQHPNDLETIKLSLLPDLKHELQQTIAASITDLHQRAESDNNRLQQQAATVLEQAFQGFDVIGQWQSRLKEQASEWLNQQQSNAQDALQQSIGPIIDDKIQQQLASELAKAIDTQLESVLVQQNAALTSQLQTQRAALENAQKRNVTLAWAAIGIALAALIISVL